MGSLKYFNFGKDFIRWISLFYKDFEICTQNFGFLSEYWKKGRGTNQGCPLSPGLYVLTAEIMANKLRNNPQIKGVGINNVEYLISQFADDTDLYLSFDQQTINSTFEVLSGIEMNTGLRISYEKTTMYRIGSLANTSAKMIIPRKVNWSSDYINTFGVNLYNETSKRDKNVEEIICKMKAIANMWYYRSMTITGKVCVINSLMASLFVYRLQTLPVLSDSVVGKIETVIMDFLRHGKKAKINLEVLKRRKEDGGLGLVDIRAKHKSLLFNWICDCNKFPKIANLAEYFLDTKLENGLVWQYNLTKQDSQKMFVGVSFWHHLIHEWHGFSFYSPQNSRSVKEEILWCNTAIKVGNKPVHVPRGDLRGPMYVGQILEGTTIMSYQKFVEVHGMEHRSDRFAYRAKPK